MHKLLVVNTISVLLYDSGIWTVTSGEKSTILFYSMQRLSALLASRGVIHIAWSGTKENLENKENSTPRIQTTGAGDIPVNGKTHPRCMKMGRKRFWQDYLLLKYLYFMGKVGKATLESRIVGRNVSIVVEKMTQTEENWSYMKIYWGYFSEWTAKSTKLELRQTLKR